MSTQPHSAQGARWQVQPTLPGASYVSEQVFAEEMRAVFARTWACIGRTEEAPRPGDYVVRELAGESLIVVHGRNGRFRAFYNVCRHRGTRLCESDGHARIFTCPYHGWSYRADDGALLRTPNVGDDEGLDRSLYSLVGVRCEEWEGFLFVNLEDNGTTLVESLEREPDGPTQYTRFGIGALRTFTPSATEVTANWKIVVENYHECLHCPGVHPELVQVIPTFQTGATFSDPDSWGVPLAPGATSLTRSGKSKLPPLPGVAEEDLTQYFGCFVFPNLFIDMSSDCVTYDILFPLAPGKTVDRGGYLFAAETIARTDFDPSEIIEFGDLVARQDNEVCERVQKGVGSRAFARGGVHPFHDRFVYGFVRRYLDMMQRGAAAPR
jgi:glycine betaine catabolism A